MTPEEQAREVNRAVVALIEENGIGFPPTLDDMEAVYLAGWKKATQRAAGIAEDAAADDAMRRRHFKGRILDSGHPHPGDFYPTDPRDIAAAIRDNNKETT